MDGFWRTIFIMLMLIALYLVVFYSGGASAVLQTIGSVTSTETKVLQGRG